MKMEDEQSALKQRLMEIAKTQSALIGQDINKTMEKSVKLEKNEAEKWVKITFLTGPGMQFSSENFGMFLSQFTEGGKPAKYELIEEGNTLVFQFEDEYLVDRVYQYYHQF